MKLWTATDVDRLVSDGGVYFGCAMSVPMSSLLRLWCDAVSGATR